MLYVNDKVAKLGGTYIGGEVTSVEIQESASIYVAQDDKGKVKTTQPVGYENAKVIIDIILEDMPGNSSLEQLEAIQRLFRTSGQTKSNLLQIVNEDCANRGITEVYFKNFSSKKVISESKRIASLELWAPKIAEIKVKKVISATKNTVKKTSSASAAKQAPSKPSLKTKTMSPAADTRGTDKAKKVAVGMAKGKKG